MILRKIFDIYGAIILVAIFIILFILETKFHLRKRIQQRRTRIIINFIVSLPGFVLLRFLLLPVMVWLAIQNKHWHFGINYLYTSSSSIHFAIGFLLLDYGNYLWHIILHKMPLMWRFHLVHHTDLDLDVTTAFRFHFGEMIGSVFFRGAMVVITGASPLLVVIYEIVFEAATQFQHSNTKLPFLFEKMLNKIIVTPRMHGIHHSMHKDETDSNFSTIFSFWDRLHKTIQLNIHQDDIIIGVPSYADEKELTAGNLLILPFKKIREWKVSEKLKPGNKNKLEK